MEVPDEIMKELFRAITELLQRARQEPRETKIERGLSTLNNRIKKVRHSKEYIKEKIVEIIRTRCPLKACEIGNELDDLYAIPKGSYWSARLELMIEKKIGSDLKTKLYYELDDIGNFIKRELVKH